MNFFFIKNLPLKKYLGFVVILFPTTYPNLDSFAMGIGLDEDLLFTIASPISDSLLPTLVLNTGSKLILELNCVQRDHRITTSMRACGNESKSVRGHEGTRAKAHEGMREAATR